MADDVKTQDTPLTDENTSLLDMIRARLVDDGLSLSTIPEVAQRVLTELQKPECSLKDLEDLIRRDQAIASSIIRVSNSSFFSGIKEVESLSDAIMRLGFTKVRNITMTFAMKNVYQGKHSKRVNRMQQLWNHSLVSAITCQEVAAVARYENREEAYLTGLVHDIGSVFIIESLDLLAESDQRIAGVHDQIVDELIRILHEESGARLLERWHFADHLCEAVNHHHNPSKIETENRLSWILAATDLITEKTGFDGSEPKEELMLSNSAPVQALKLSDLEVARLTVDLEEKVEGMQRVWS